MVEAVQDGQPIVPIYPRRPGKRAVIVLQCAVKEATLQSWDVIGPDAPAIRREARELAARAVDPGTRRIP